jgi:hypothetical protein
MRAATRALAVLSVGGALMLSGTGVSVAAPCPVGTYPPGQSCSITPGTTQGQVSGSTSGGSTSGGSTSGGSSTGSVPAPSASPEVVVTTPEPAASPTSDASSGGTTGGTTGAGTQAGGSTPDTDSALSPMAYALGTAALILILGLVVFLLARRRKSPIEPAH